MNIKIEDHVSPYLKKLIADLPKEVAKAINYLAYDARDEFLKNQLEKNFTLRKPWFKPGNAFGFNVTKATPDNTSATIFSRAPWMQMQETGGNKLPRRQHIALPTEQVRRSKKDLILKSQRPGALGAKLFHLKTDEGKDVLAMNFGRGKSRITKIMYTLRSKTHLWPRLKFKKSIEAYVKANAEKKLLKVIGDLLNR